MATIKTEALLITPGSEVCIKEISLRQRNAKELETTWFASSVCNSERRRFNLTKSHDDVKTFIGGHEAIGILSEDTYIKKYYALLPHSNCMTRNEKNKCLACTNGAENLCSDMRHAGLDEGTPSGFTEKMFVPKSQLYDVTDIDPEIAAFLEPLACVMHSWEKVGFDYENGSNVINIVGGGPIGCLHALYANKKNDQNQVFIFEENLDRFNTLNKRFKDIENITITHGDVYKSSDITVMAASNNSAYEKSVNVTKTGGTVLLFSGFDDLSYADRDFLPEVIHRYEFTHYASGLIFVGSSGYTQNDLKSAKRILLNFEDVKRIVTGKVYGLSSKKLLNYDGSSQIFDDSVLIKDIKGHFSEHIKIQYFNNAIDNNGNDK